MDSCDIIATTSAIACSIEKCYSKEDTVILAKIFYQLSTTLFTMLEIDKTCEIIAKKNTVVKDNEKETEKKAEKDDKTVLKNALEKKEK